MPAGRARCLATEASSIEISARHATGEGVALEIDALGLAEAWAAGEAEAARQSLELEAGRCEDIW